MPCNIANTLNLIGDKWSLLILHEILLGNETYNDIKNRLEGIPSNLLSQRLKSLEDDKLIISDLYQQHPPRYCYRLTDSGKDLEDVFNCLILWGSKHLRPCYKKIVHKKCGHPVILQYYCPHCKQVVEHDSRIITKSAENMTNNEDEGKRQENE